MKRYLLLSLTLIVTFVLASCAPAAPPEPTGPVTVDVWFHSGKGEERDVLDAQVTGVEREST